MWNPTTYLAFTDQRARPFVELTARIAVTAPRRVVDLGCGPGNSTVTLTDRWPDAAIDAIDDSPEMVRAARANGVDARLLDVREWEPMPDTDVVISNATLQWVPEHRDLMRRWPTLLPAGATIAVQMPGNFDAPSHRIIRELATSAHWRHRLAGLELRHSDAVDDPEDYADLLSSTGCEVDAWETTYVQQLRGADPVLEWVSGTALTPVLALLDTSARDEFRAELAPALADAYPVRPDGSTFFPFRRIFVVATVRKDN